MPLLHASLDALIRRTELAEKLQELVGIESVVENGHTEAAVVDAVSRWCQADGLNFQSVEVSPDRPNLLIEWMGDQSGPTLLFEAHSDTVTAGDVARWTRPPFQMTREGDRLYGRGTADTKGNLVAAYVGLRALAQHLNGHFSGRILLLMPVDEEGMMTGIRHFIASGAADSVAAAVCCEPEDAQVCVRQKGALRLRVEIQGKMAHGAMPLTGNNPLPVVARFLLAMEEAERAEQQRVGFDPYLGWPSITPTEIQAPVAGPSGFNVVPDSSSLSLDIRTVVGQSHPDLIEQVRQRLDQVIAEANRRLGEETRVLRERLEETVDPGEYTGRLIVLDDRPVTNTPIDSPIVAAMASAVKARLGTPAVFSGVPGATDGTWLWDAGIPIATTGAGMRFVPHQADEWVSLTQLHDMAVIYADAAHRFLTDPSTQSEVD